MTHGYQTLLGLLGGLTGLPLQDQAYPSIGQKTIMVDLVARLAKVGAGVQRNLGLECKTQLRWLHYHGIGVPHTQVHQIWLRAQLTLTAWACLKLGIRGTRQGGGQKVPGVLILRARPQVLMAPGAGGALAGLLRRNNTILLPGTAGGSTAGGMQLVVAHGDKVSGAALKPQSHQ